MDSLAMLAHIARDLAATSDTTGVMRSIFDRLASSDGVDVLLSFVMSDGRLRPASHIGLAAEADSALERGDAEEGLSLAAASERTPLVTEDLQRSEDARAAFARSLGLQAYACFPLLAR